MLTERSWPPWFVVVRDPCDAGNHAPCRENPSKITSTAFRSTSHGSPQTGPTARWHAYINSGVTPSHLAHKPISQIGPAKPGAPRCGVRFATTDERDAASVRLELEGMIVAELEGVGPSSRGRLAEAIAEVIDRELVARGWGVPGLTDASDHEATLSDQLFRARCAGATGIAIVLGPLRAAVGEQGALDPNDSYTLRLLARAAQERPLAVVLDSSDANTLAYGDPIILRDLLSARAASAAPVPIQSSNETIESSTPTPPPISSQTSTFTPRSDDHPIHPVSAWRSWTLELVAARGPQPLGKLERLVTDAYVPLANALAEGLDDTGARRARDEFRDTFASGYTDAFPTFASTTKRPRMVFDVYDLAARIARLHGARTTRLLLVDAMRCDVARAIQARVVARCGPRAALTDELVLWSALPSTTMRQLETIARGVEALRAPALIEQDAQPPRGRGAELVRRMRVGPRELHKLDLLESRLFASRGKVLQDLPEIAESVAEVLARHVETQAARTLLFVFGDHGFTLDKDGVARCGGATPEEVLVGAFALFTGEVH
jgi:hypothetical protein